MKMRLLVATKWANTDEDHEIDTWEDLGVSDVEWDRMSSADKYDMLQDYVLELIGFGFSADY